jgi:hypothetical protein
MVTKRRISTILILLTIVLNACQATPSPAAGNTPQAASTLNATLSELTGSVSLRQPGAADFALAANGVQLQVGGQVRTGEDGRARLDLSSGTVVRVTPSSLFTLAANEPAPDNSLATRIKLEVGKIFVILSGGSLDVETPDGLASVRGSYMMTETLPGGGVRITCLEGTCELETQGGKVTLTNGQTAEVQNAGQAPIIGQMTDEQVQDWLDNNPEAILVIPTPTDTLPSMPTETATPEGTGATGGSPNACFSLLDPASGSAFDSQGLATFKWEEMPGAVEYELNFDIPGGYSASFKSEGNSHKRYLASFSLGGTYSWSVTAYDANHEKICTAGPWTFTKKAYIPTSTPYPTRRPQEPTETPSGCGTVCAPPSNCICP